MPKKRGGGESSSFGLANLRRDLHLNRIFRQQSTSGGFSQPSDLLPSCGASVSSAAGGLHLPSGGHARRESFLYKASTDDREILACRPVSRASSVASNVAVDHPPHGDDLIVTPFAQILASLRNVRNSFFAVCNLQIPDDKYKSIKKPPVFDTRLCDSASQMALEAMEELDWCLEQLETVQTHRSVSEMASNKFRKLLNKELSQFAESSKSGGQISRFLINTYMDHDDEENNTVDLPSVEINSEASTSSSPQMSLLGKAKTAAMSRISGVRRLKASHGAGGNVPEYGVECAKEIVVYMQQLNDWGPNVFKIHELSKGHALTSITYSLLHQRGLLKTFEIPSHQLITYLLHLEHHYRENPYHNQIHAADVAQSMHVLISSPALKDVFTDLEILAAIMAGAMHDVDHPGFTNQYLINSNSELAIMYNDESVLEQHHLAVAFKLLQESNCDFLSGFSKKQRQTFRKIVIDMVLATDMSKHMSLLADLKTMVEAKKVSGSHALELDKYNDRIQVLQSMIHLADLSNPTKPIELYRCWNERICEEYWRQGDREKDLGLEISPMCDRTNVTLEKSQVGFIDYIVHPIFETWADLVYPHAQNILDQLEENRQWYQARIPEETDSARDEGGGEAVQQEKKRTVDQLSEEDIENV
ncbi:hypothetical protein QR680_000032 [Steinernema hermaphroditum]|uniref:Phosphodiesterase n=1 Tax=Steinernema hermaphroditum TaxID=289476 RepID=A0AA39LDC0_9BILA|nr:hypothetical protein QR680_000032 [Steinernema hermaphroditum]